MSVSPNCPPFTNNQLFETFWAPGVSPSDYDKNLLPSSFWIWSKKQLYILGGSKGDVDRSDTDHFDSTIIIHEYAHVLEDQFSIRDSVGGAHFGDNILDPPFGLVRGLGQLSPSGCDRNPPISRHHRQS